jgi:hypothetical protein
MPIYSATDLPEKVGSTTKDPEIAAWLPNAPVF